MNLGTATILRADARSMPLPDDSVDLIVTSPPYFALRSYQDGGEHYDGQIGSEPTPGEFLDALLEVTAEWVRVLKPSGSLWVNLGDKYSQRVATRNSSHQSGINGAAYAKNWKEDKAAGRARMPYQNVIDPTSGRYVPEKSLMGLPWRYAIRCIDELGLILRAEVIWSKPNGLPESVTDRVRRSHEQWFHFTLQPRYYSAVDEIREPQQSAGQRHEGRSGWVNAEGKAGGHEVTRGFTERALNPLGKLPGSVWTVPTEPLRVPETLGIDHFAAFPTEWPKRIIQGWSPSGVCTACDAPLIPVTRKEGGRPVARAHRHLPGYSDPAGEGVRDLSYRIEGYSCQCPPHPTSIASAKTTANTTQTTTAPDAAAVDGYQSPIRDATAPTRPAVVLDPFGGTGTTALVAKALGRHGITIDLSADYCRLATWRTNDRNQLAKVLGIPKSDAPTQEESLFDLDGGAA